MMEKKLRALFAYQKFEKSPKLNELIEETHDRLGKELSDDDLETLAAAGETDAPTDTETIGKINLSDS